MNADMVTLWKPSSTWRADIRWILSAGNKYAPLKNLPKGKANGRNVCRIKASRLCPNLRPMQLSFRLPTATTCTRLEARASRKHAQGYKYKYTAKTCTTTLKTITRSSRTEQWKELSISLDRRTTRVFFTVFR